jgi:hypothetical protein
VSDDEKESPPPPSERPDMTRRKLMYAAPILMSQRLFNGVTGCGKANPGVHSCTVVAMHS